MKGARTSAPSLSEAASCNELGARMPIRAEARAGRPVNFRDSQA